MGNIIETSVFEEMMEAEEGFAEMVELIHEVDGEVITESVEDVRWFCIANVNWMGIGRRILSHHT